MNEYEVHELVAGDRRCWWDETLQAYVAQDVSGKGLAYAGDRIVRTPTGFAVEARLDECL